MYLSDDNTVPYVLEIVALFKKDQYEEVISIILENNIDPQYSNNIICDYAALWLREPLLIPFYEKMKDIGGNPVGHDSMMKNCIKYGKEETVKYLIDNGILDSCHNELVYFINIAIMDKQQNILEILDKYIEIDKYCLFGENNPSCVNVALYYQNKEAVDYLFDKNIMQKYIFTEEAISKLEKAEDSFKRFYIKKVLDNFGLPEKEDYLNHKGYERGDMAAVFKVIEYDLLDRDLNLKKSSNAVKRAKI